MDTKLTLTWRECRSYADAKTTSKGVYVYGRDAECFYVGKLDRASFGRRYNLAYSHWIESCLTLGARLYCCELRDIDSSTLGELEASLIRTWNPRMNKERRPPTGNVRLVHAGDVPPWHDIQGAIRARIAPGTTLYTIPRRAPFVVDDVNDDGVVLRLGDGRWRAPLSWECIAGIGGFLRGRGCVRVGGVFGPGKPGTLHQYLLGCDKRMIANYVAALLEKAGVVDINRREPLHIQLKAGF